MYRNPGYAYQQAVTTTSSRTLLLSWVLMGKVYPVSAPTFKIENHNSKYARCKLETTEKNANVELQLQRNESYSDMVFVPNPEQVLPKLLVTFKRPSPMTAAEADEETLNATRIVFVVIDRYRTLDTIRNAKLHEIGVVFHVYYLNPPLLSDWKGHEQRITYLLYGIREIADEVMHLVYNLEIPESSIIVTEPDIEKNMTYRGSYGIAEHQIKDLVNVLGPDLSYLPTLIQSRKREELVKSMLKPVTDERRLETVSETLIDSYPEVSRLPVSFPSFLLTPRSFSRLVRDCEFSVLKNLN